MVHNLSVDVQDVDRSVLDEKLSTDVQTSLLASDPLRSKDPTAFVSSDTQIKILNVLSSEYPNRLKTSELSERLYLHRSTIGGNVNELIDLGLVDKKILQRTKNHVNPTFLFSISPDYISRVRSFLKVKQQVQPDLLDEISSSASKQLNLEIPQSFEGQVKLLFLKLTQQISCMQEEINELKERLNERSYSHTDLSDVVRMVDSLDGEE